MNTTTNAPHIAVSDIAPLGLNGWRWSVRIDGLMDADDEPLRSEADAESGDWSTNQRGWGLWKDSHQVWGTSQWGMDAKSEAQVRSIVRRRVARSHEAQGLDCCR